VNIQSLALIIIGSWLGIVSTALLLLYLHYRNLTSGVNKKDLISSLNHLISLGQDNSDQVVKIKKQLIIENENSKKYLQKVGFTRFNPFTDTGGDQSFVLALLDANNSGVVISSLHSRESTRIYAKKIDCGKSSGQALSKEEAEVVRQAQQNHNELKKKT